VSVGPSYTESNQLKWWRHLERQCLSVLGSIQIYLFVNEDNDENPKPGEVESQDMIKITKTKTDQNLQSRILVITTVGIKMMKKKWCRYQKLKVIGVSQIN